jgi:hypothetical protein
VNVTLRRSIAAASALLAVPMLASCGLAFTAQTEQEYTPTIGVSDRSGTVDVIDALIVTKSGGAGTLVAGLVNNDERRPDQLTSVTGAKSDTSLTVQGDTPIRIDANGAYQLADQGNIKVYGSQLKPGYFVWVTFNFANAKSITMDIPVTAPYNGLQQVPLPTSSVPTMSPLPSPTPKKHKPSPSSSPTS